jgi:hypothetical protein
MLPIGNNIGRHQRCPLMLPPATHKGRCCRGLSARWLAHAFAWWRLSLSVSVCGSSFLPLDTLRSDAHAITRYTSALCYNPPRQYSRYPLVGIYRWRFPCHLMPTLPDVLPPSTSFLYQCVISRCPCYAHAKTMPISVSPEGTSLAHTLAPVAPCAALCAPVDNSRVPVDNFCGPACGQPVRNLWINLWITPGGGLKSRGRARGRACKLM